MNGKAQSIAMGSIGCALLASITVSGVCAVNKVPIPDSIAALGVFLAGALAGYVGNRITNGEKSNGLRKP